MTEASKGDTQKTVVEAVRRVLEKGGVAALATIVEGPGESIGAKLLIEESGEFVGSTKDKTLDQSLLKQAASFISARLEARTYKVDEINAELSDWSNARVLFERIEPEPHIVVCGAGHVGASLARLAHAAGYRVTVIDDRADFVERERFPASEIALVAAKDWRDAVRDVVGNGRGVSVAVVTRGHNEDEECLRAVLSAGPDYVGMIGSKRRTNIVLERLRETGVDEALLREVRAPIGLDIGAVSPEEVALSILAEIIAERRGGTGAPLSQWRRKESKR